MPTDKKPHLESPEVPSKLEDEFLDRAEDLDLDRPEDQLAWADLFMLLDPGVVVKDD